MTPLVAILTRHRPALASVITEARAEALVAAAQQAWPGVPLDAASFIDHLGARLPDGDEAVRAFDLLHASDLYLACACERHQTEALAAFEQAHLSSSITGTIAKVDASPDFIDEVRQRVRERLLVGEQPRIAEYGGRGPLGGWVRVVALRTALNLQREAAVRGRVRAQPEPAGDLEHELMQRRYRDDVQAAFRTAFIGLDDAARQLLRSHYLEGASLEEIGRRQAVDRSTVSRRVASLRRHLMEETRRELERRIPAISSASRDSLLMALRSQLDFSLESILRT
jgi:RNA polymerase sigma-70 factor (ECF subfamily)